MCEEWQYGIFFLSFIIFGLTEHLEEMENVKIKENPAPLKGRGKKKKKKKTCARAATRATAVTMPNP